MKFISLTSDFGKQSQGVGIMEGTALSIAPDARIVHLMHGLPEFDITPAARTMETVSYLPVGCHVCICDPGVGTSRRALICQVERGDYLIGPDNGVLIPGTRFLGGLKRVHEITNPDYMRQPVSPIFHGRDVFVPAAAHLSNGVPLEEFGAALHPSDLVSAPYEEATRDGEFLRASVIQINRYGSLHLNITHQQWDALDFRLGDPIRLTLPSDRALTMPFRRTFGEVATNEPVILKDDYGRVEIAINLGSFAERYGMAVNDEITIHTHRSR